jgi:uncharacterized protein YndB with AHSA1/START domain
MSEQGRYVEVEGRPAVRFDRTYPHPVQRVWAAVTDPDQLACWYPSTVSVEPRVGGVIRFSADPNADDASGTVLDYDPPRRFAFTWGDDEVQLDLTAIDENHCRLSLTNVLSARDTAARNAAGWTVCVGELDKVLVGIATDGPHSAANQAAFQPLYDGYVAAGLPAGAPIPGSG